MVYGAYPQVPSRAALQNICSVTHYRLIALYPFVAAPLIEARPVGLLPWHLLPSWAE